jgi:hypothetical protein
MVENVREHGAELRADTFGNLDVLLDAEVHVPEGLAAEVASAAVDTIVDAQDGLRKQLETAPGSWYNSGPKPFDPKTAPPPTG